VEGEKRGPVSDHELKRLASEGTLKPTDLIWREGMSDWKQPFQGALLIR
jgi:hypothetical protein